MLSRKISLKFKAIPQSRIAQVVQSQTLSPVATMLVYLYLILPSGIPRVAPYPCYDSRGHIHGPKCHLVMELNFDSNHKGKIHNLAEDNQHEQMNLLSIQTQNRNQIQARSC